MNITHRKQLILAAATAVAVILLIVQPWDSGSIRLLWDGERPGYWGDDYSLSALEWVNDPELHNLQIIPRRVTITRTEVSTLSSEHIMDIHEYAAQDNALFSIESSDPLTLTFYEKAHDAAGVNFYYNDRWGRPKIYGLSFNQSYQRGMLQIAGWRYGVPSGIYG